MNHVRFSPAVPHKRRARDFSRVLPMKLQFYLRNPKLTLEFPNFKLIFYLLYLLISLNVVNDLCALSAALAVAFKKLKDFLGEDLRTLRSSVIVSVSLQKGGVPATPSGTATLLRLSPNYRFRPSTLLSVTCFRRPRLSWLDGRCVQGPGTYSPRHG